ncbi:ATP-binding cassette domain-containing protein [Bacillus mangrovi]|uniref:ATP-binding cassette domain-containing protein n=1 Tax=Metabacillus mangrovi TaxID=1491830 RepID=A0A7X2S9G6_9BACI|nr:ABC transporter ATP-binding protein [Metabacillus mangrovi]MTH55747.1 ATP-binding cassette domain-containing protein [Metabacillus mangrovi]
MLEVKNVSKVYEGKVSYRALSKINLSIKPGEFVGVMGPSGSGKTTLLNMVSTIDVPSSGEILIDGKNPSGLSAKELALFRRRELGFIFQHFNLLPTLTVKENIVLSMTLDGIRVKEMNEKAEQIAEKLGISSILDKRTYEISGGQAQRTAIARAIIYQPKLILADEPTGNLDSKSAKDVLGILETINREARATMMMVTHDAFAASHCDRVIFIKDGKLHNELTKGEGKEPFYKKIMKVLAQFEEAAAASF